VANAPPGRIIGEPEALAILLRNLIDNALKYTPRGGTVDVSVSEGEGVTLIVEDNGPGIEPEGRERALARFDRLGGLSSGTAGSGLGLAIVKTIAERHHARLHLDRSGRLGGLQVSVSFPAKPHLRRNPDMPPP
jgi:two-component system OmpR family sensor kinase